MSKKPAHVQETSVSEKVPRFAGWIFFFGAVIELVAVFLDILVLDRIVLSLILFFATNAGACYVFGAMVEKNPGEKYSIFKDWLISALIFNIVFIGSMAAYIF